MIGRLRSAAVLGVFLTVVSCGSVSRAATGGQHYTVTASLLQKPGSDLTACNGVLLSLPPAGCGGVTVRGLDIDSLPGVTRYGNGVKETRGAFRLVGTWDGHALTLLRRPEAASMNAESKISPECQQEPGTTAGGPTPPLMQRVIDDQALLRSNGIELLEFYACKGTVFLGLAVADPESVAFLTNRYGHVEIGSWLKPTD